MSMLFVCVSACRTLSWNSLGVEIAGVKIKRPEKETTDGQDHFDRKLQLGNVIVMCVKLSNPTHTHAHAREHSRIHSNVGKLLFLCSLDWLQPQVLQIAPLLSCVTVWRRISRQVDTDRPTPWLIELCRLDNPAASPHCCPPPPLLTLQP